MQPAKGGGHLLPAGSYLATTSASSSSCCQLPLVEVRLLLMCPERTRQISYLKKVKNFKEILERKKKDKLQPAKGEGWAPDDNDDDDSSIEVRA